LFTDPDGHLRLGHVADGLGGADLQTGVGELVVEKLVGWRGRKNGAKNEKE